MEVHAGVHLALQGCLIVHRCQAGNRDAAEGKGNRRYGYRSIVLRFPAMKTQSAETEASDDASVKLSAGRKLMIAMELGTGELMTGLSYHNGHSKTSIYLMSVPNCIGHRS